MRAILGLTLLPPPPFQVFQNKVLFLLLSPHRRPRAQEATAAGSKAVGVGGAGLSRLLAAWSPCPRTPSAVPCLSRPPPPEEASAFPPQRLAPAILVLLPRSPSSASVSATLNSTLSSGHISSPNPPCLSYLTHRDGPLFGESPQLSLDVEDDLSSGSWHHQGKAGLAGASDTAQTSSAKLLWVWRFLGRASGIPLQERGGKREARPPGPWVPELT